MEIRFTQSARRHRIGRGSVRFVMANTNPVTATTSRGTPGWRWVGDGDHEAVLLVIHVMPTHYRKEPS
ncbi:MAG: hypothetical protein ACRDVP_09825 [Acidimicrobiales bacterium]